MAKQTNGTSERNASDSCPSPATPPKPAVGPNFQGEFDWSSELQGYLLGIGFLSYLTTQTTAGIFADTVGSKSLLVFSNALTGLLVIISPFAARWHVYALMVVQFLRGASQGLTTPAIFKLTSNWIPKAERGTLNTLVVCGYSTGAAVSGIVTGWLCDIPGLGWPSAFYIWGSISILIAVVTRFVCYEHPTSHPWITDYELKHITEGLENIISEKKHPVPWKKMFTSVPSYAYFYALLGHYWGINYFTTVHPTFMGTVLHYSMAENGLSSCLPLLIVTVTSVLGSFMSHLITKKNLIGVDKLRRAATFSSGFLFSLCMAVLLLAGCDTLINVLCFAFSMFSLGIGSSGVCISGVDMAPAFAGSLMGVATTVAGLGSVLVPVITGLLTRTQTLSEWRLVFGTNLLVVGSSGLLYWLFGSAEVQPWNFPESKQSTESTNGERRHADNNRKQAIEMKEKI